MDKDFNFKTLVWDGEFTYGPYTAKNWFSVGGPEHPLFKTLISRMENEIPELKHFKTYVNGGLLEDWMSWDVDITITGEYQPKFLNLIFTKTLEISFDLHLWVDINYQEVMWRPDLMRSDDLNEMSAWCYEPYNTFSRDGDYQELTYYEPIDGMFRRLNKYPFPKHIEKLNQGHIYQPPIVLFE